MNSFNFYLFYSHLLSQEASVKTILPAILKNGNLVKPHITKASQEPLLDGYLHSLSNSGISSQNEVLGTRKRQNPRIDLFLFGSLRGCQALGKPKIFKKLDVLNSEINLNLQQNQRLTQDSPATDNGSKNLLSKPNRKFQGLALKLANLSYFKGINFPLKGGASQTSKKNGQLKIFKLSKQNSQRKFKASRTPSTFGLGTEFLHSFNQKLTSQAFNLNFLSHLGNLVCLSHYYSPLNSRFGDLVMPKKSNPMSFREKAPSLIKRRGDHQLSLASWFPLVDRQEVKHISRENKTSETRKPASDTTRFDPLTSDRRIKMGISSGLITPKSWGGVGVTRQLAKGFHRVEHYGDSTAFNSLQDLTVFYSASWLLREIQDQLSGRKSNIKAVLSRIFLSAQQPTFQSLGKSLAKEEVTIIPHLIKGLKVTLTGCMGGKKNMSKTLTKTAGRVPTSTLLEKVDFAKGVVQTKTCSLGVKVWVCYN